MHLHFNFDASICQCLNSQIKEEFRVPCTLVCHSFGFLHQSRLLPAEVTEASRSVVSQQWLVCRIVRALSQLSGRFFDTLIGVAVRTVTLRSERAIRDFVRLRLFVKVHLRPRYDSPTFCRSSCRTWSSTG